MILTKVDYLRTPQDLNYLQKELSNYKFFRNVQERLSESEYFKLLKEIKFREFDRLDTIYSYGA